MRLFSFMGSLMSAALSALCRKGIVSLRNTVLARPKDRRQLCIAEQGFKRGDRRRALRWHVAHDYLDRENPLGPTTAEPFTASFQERLLQIREKRMACDTSDLYHLLS
jgi:hypothetical protein